MGEIAPPTPISTLHDLNTFNCGLVTLNDWLIKRALHNEREHASRTFVICDDKKVIGYYTLALGSIMRGEANNRLRRNMPDPIPIMVLGRLAIDITHQGRGFGPSLLKDAVQRSINVSTQAGCKALLVHAINISAKIFYQRFGFLESPTDAMTLMLPLKSVLN